MMIKLTTNHHGKMEGLESLNTSVLDNKFCQKKNGVCQKCYARRLESYRKELHAKLLHNSKLVKRTISYDKLPVINTLYFRFHSFGELHNKSHFKNLCNIAKKNPKVNFALWTKRIELVNQAIKPDNLILIYSNPLLNSNGNIPDGFDKVFNVYDKKHSDNVNINCSGKCIDCLLCYKKDSTNHVYENLK